MNPFTTALLSFLAAHLVGDFVLQSDAEVQAKSRLSIRHHAGHAAKVALLTFVLLGSWQPWWQVLIVTFLSHFIIDLLKMRGLQGAKMRNVANTISTGDRLGAFLFDQFLHLASMFALACYLVAMDLLPSDGGYWFHNMGNWWIWMLIHISGLTLVVSVGGCLIAILIEPFLLQIRVAQKDAELTLERRGFENGGRVIGWLERGLIYLFVVTGQPAGVGFLVAAKSIFRFGELKDPDQRMEAEYIIIGTLMSFGWALACAWLTVCVLKTV